MVLTHPTATRKLSLVAKPSSKSADTEEVELSVYPDSGSLDSPPEVEVWRKVMY